MTYSGRLCFVLNIVAEGLRGFLKARCAGCAGCAEKCESPKVRGREDVDWTRERDSFVLSAKSRVGIACVRVRERVCVYVCGNGGEMFQGFVVQLEPLLVLAGDDGWRSGMEINSQTSHVVVAKSWLWLWQKGVSLEGLRT